MSQTTQLSLTSILKEPVQTQFPTKRTLLCSSDPVSSVGNEIYRVSLFDELGDRQFDRTFPGLNPRLAIGAIQDQGEVKSITILQAAEAFSGMFRILAADGANAKENRGFPWVMESVLNSPPELDEHYLLYKTLMRTSLNMMQQPEAQILPYDAKDRSQKAILNAISSDPAIAERARQITIGVFERELSSMPKLLKSLSPPPAP